MGGGSAALGNAGVNPNTGMAMTPVPGMNPTAIGTGSNALAPGLVYQTPGGPMPQRPQQPSNPAFTVWNDKNNPLLNFNGGNSGQGNAGQNFVNNPYLMNLRGGLR